MEGDVEMQQAAQDPLPEAIQTDSKENGAKPLDAPEEPSVAPEVPETLQVSKISDVFVSRVLSKEQVEVTLFCAV